MITLNDDPIKIDSFPDGTILMKCPKVPSCRIRWTYENDREFLALIYLVKHLRSNGYSEIGLHMPYIPNARQDRVKSQWDIFTLKYFAELLNSLELDYVRVLDPHSSVSEALINKLNVESPEDYIYLAISKIHNTELGDKNLMVFYPDSGSVKRYADMVKLPYAFGVKQRNWETGKIEGLDVVANYDDDDINPIIGHDILIVDDICSRGGTFYHSAMKLKELGAKDIYLYVSHCENTILEGELLKGDLIKKVYTTDSIFTKSHEKIEVLK